MGYYEDGPVETMQDEAHMEEQEQSRPVGARLSGFRERLAGALAGLDRGRIDQFSLDSGAHLDEEHDVLDEVSGAEEDMGMRPQFDPEAQSDAEPEPDSELDEPAPFPVGRLGYNRAAVDARIAELEAELEELRAIPPQPSITEEIERLGEQTASILVVAHDQAHETTRLAQEQADRCIADAATNAVAITEKAKRDLHEIDEETDTVWRERTRLLEDARNVGSALIALSEAASARFPAEGKPPEQATSAFPPPVREG
ncbi:MAG: hypothetical protein ABI323_13520 [Solirubrobacteraceae bacterium]